ncbi:MAG: ribonuclease H-like domain-containing protein [Hyphomicrobiales bacterium]|jgi:ribonuclease D|nr:ribonuclease H-like domain-containing protein [Hyphomicrobiales bacterium]
MHFDDLPDNINLGNEIAIDTETLGLNPNRDRLCLIQLKTDNDEIHLIKINKDKKPAPNLLKILKEEKILKIFHFARFDVAILNRTYDISINNIYCTKIASKIARTYTDRHGLKDLCKELLNIELSKEQQSSDWGAKELTDNQKKYAANDVIYLHDIKKNLDQMLQRENRYDLAYACFKFLNTQVELDLRGWHNQNIFDH